VRTISLASNGIETLAFFAELSRFVPELENLSLKDNLIRNYNQLAAIRGHEFKNMRELILTGNPVLTKEIQIGSEINFKR
jgi:hypothetical protein